MRYIRNLFAIQTRALLVWPICRSIDLMLISTPLKPNTRTLSRPNTDAPGRLGGNWLKRNRRQLQLSHKDSCVIKVSVMQNTPIYSRKKPLNCYHGRYTYRLISWLLCLPRGQQVGLDDIWKKKAIRDLFAKQTPKVNCYHGHARYTVYTSLCKGRYSDKQTTKCSRPFTTLV